MIWNCPRLGPDGGFIHKESGKFLCADIEAQVVISHPSGVTRTQRVAGS
jgi:hypothetical protein